MTIGSRFIQLYQYKSRFITIFISFSALIFRAAADSTYLPVILRKVGFTLRHSKLIIVAIFKLLNISVNSLIKTVSANVGLGFCCLTGCILTFSISASAAEKTINIPEVWTAALAVDFAVNNSPDSRIALERMAAAKAEINQARTGYFPHIDISGQYGQTNNPMYSFGNILNQGNFSSAIDFNDPGRTDDLNLQVGIGYRFYNQGRDQAAVEAAQAGLSKSRQDREIVLDRLALEVVRSFQAIVRAEEIVRARQAALDAGLASLSVADSRYRAGDLLKADLLNLEVQVSQARENLIMADHGLELSHKIFLNLLGLEQENVTINSSSDCEQLLPAKRSYDLRPELKSLDASEEAAKAMLKAARGGNLPTVDGFASYQYEKGYVDTGEGDSWMAGVKVNYALFEGNKTSADISRAMADLAIIRAQRKKIKLRMDLELKQAELNYRQAVERCRVTEKMVGQADESARLSRLRFRQGLLLSSELIDIETRLTDALVRRSVARSNIKVAIADLRWAMGLPQYNERCEPEKIADQEVIK